MNEGLAVFLNIDAGRFTENEAFIKRIDDLLLESGIKYSGFRNIYRPIEEKGRDDAVFSACRVLREADWLKGKLADVSILNRVDACPMDRIGLGNMSEPSASKLEYYEKYYRKSNMLAHGIVVDEYGKIRDGYASYIIAAKYGLRPDIYEALVKQPLGKIVRGRHILRDGDGWKVKSGKVYTWNYSLKAPVVPGDIVAVRTQKGKAFICVREIDYVTGTKFCQEHRNVISHMGKCLQEPI